MTESPPRDPCPDTTALSFRGTQSTVSLSYCTLSHIGSSPLKTFILVLTQLSLVGSLGSSYFPMGEAPFRVREAILGVSRANPAEFSGPSCDEEDTTLVVLASS